MANDNLNNILGGAASNQIPQDILFKTGLKKKKRTSIFDEEPEINNTEVPKVSDEIVIPPSIRQIAVENKKVEKKKIDTLEEMKRLQNSRAKAYKHFQNVEPVPEQIEEVKENLEQITGEELPKNVNYFELEAELQDAAENIPDINENDYLNEIEIKPVPVKDKSGYFKTTVGIKGDFPQEVLKIASYVKQKTKGLIFPRKCDFRVIGNTNKTQLKNSKIKLSMFTIVFKPDFQKLKVNKGTRFMISIPQDYESTGNLLIYIQESRAKKILELTPKDFKSKEHFLEFIGDCIVEYYISGYDVTLKKLEIRGVNNPLMDLINQIVKTNEYKAKPYTNDESHIYAVDFISKDTKNQWLRIQVIEGDIPGTYQIIAKNNIMQDWEYQLTTKPLTLKYLLDGFYTLLNKCYDKDWSKELSIDTEDDKIYYELDKLTHSKLKKAYLYINELKTENPDLGIVLGTTLSKKDLQKSLSTDYDAEAFVGKTNFVKFVLSYMAVQIIGGDKRSGADYITRDEYYQKYSVSNKNKYQQRNNTVLRKEGSLRNYNSRIYMFQLEYYIDGKRFLAKDSNWDKLLETTGFLTNSPKGTISNI